ncbi:baseplate J/gp47 family protein [Acinetobacter schindleri]|uniref:baseplate J/gp47 family protein n=1 Tax=Acinetobacter schindleri TaxID=108981 RepID=UPI00289EED1A|nr:baseplate J/gp47 family protein [Acinetobacter schindleri]
MELTTLAPTIDDSGIHAPTYDQILAWLKGKYRSIYGDDVYLENDSLDGQWLGILALQFSQVNGMCIQTYNSFSPKTAGTDALTRNVKINGIKRALPTYSTVDVTLIGSPGTAIKNGSVGDTNNNKWILPALITIPPFGEITVTARSEKAGAVFATAGSVTKILTPTRGWSSVSNANTSSMGQDIENNARLRQRQALSTANASMSQTEAIRGSLLALDNVTRCKTFENKTNTTDDNGLPPKSVCIVVSGGDGQEIANIMHIKKSMGCAWYGNTSVTIMNSYGDPCEVSFYRPDIKNISFHMQITTIESYSADTADSIAENLASYVNELDIGDKILLNKLYGPANLYGAAQSKTYEIENITIQVDGVDIIGDYTLPFGCVAFCDPSQIAIEVTSA